MPAVYPVRPACRERGRDQLLLRFVTTVSGQRGGKMQMAGAGPGHFPCGLTSWSGRIFFTRTGIHFA